MKNQSVLVLGSILLVSISNAQEIKNNRIPMLGEQAPEFTAESTQGIIHFPGDGFDKWKILFSHPADFTPVCSTEILELAEMQDEFKKLNAKLYVLSTDGLNSHIEWEKSLESLNYKNREKVTIDFPLISDVNLLISEKYGMIHPESSTTKDVRGVFIVDPENRIAAISFYPMSTGRNLEEIKRTLIAMQKSEDFDILTPANWKPGDDVLLPSPKSNEEAAKMERRNDPNIYSVDWYIWFKKMK